MEETSSRRTRDGESYEDKERMTMEWWGEVREESYGLKKVVSNAYETLSWWASEKNADHCDNCELWWCTK